MKLLADVGAGLGIGYVNDWPALLPTVIIIVLRIVLEWLILRNKKADKEKEN